MALFKKYPVLRLAALILLNIFDVAITYYGIKAGIVEELNPLGKILIGLGWPLACFVKFAWLTVISVLFLYIYKEAKKIVDWALNILVVWYLFVVVNNIYHCFFG